MMFQMNPWTTHSSLRGLASDAALIDGGDFGPSMVGKAATMSATTLAVSTDDTECGVAYTGGQYCAMMEGREVQVIRGMTNTESTIVRVAFTKTTEPGLNRAPRTLVAKDI